MKELDHEHKSVWTKGPDRDLCAYKQGDRIYINTNYLDNIGSRPPFPIDNVDTFNQIRGHLDKLGIATFGEQMTLEDKWNPRRRLELIEKAMILAKTAQGQGDLKTIFHMITTAGLLSMKSASFLEDNEAQILQDCQADQEP